MDNKEKPLVVVVYNVLAASHRYLSGLAVQRLSLPPFSDRCTVKSVFVTAPTLTELRSAFQGGLFKRAAVVVSIGVAISVKLRDFSKKYGVRPIVTIAVPVQECIDNGLIQSVQTPGRNFTGVCMDPYNLGKIGSFIQMLKPIARVITIPVGDGLLVEALRGEFTFLREFLLPHGLDLRFSLYAKKDGKRVDWLKRLTQESDAILLLEGNGIAVSLEDLAKLCDKEGRTAIGCHGAADIRAGFGATIGPGFPKMVDKALELVCSLLTTGAFVGAIPMAVLPDDRELTVNAVVLRQVNGAEQLLEASKENKNITVVRHWPKGL